MQYSRQISGNDKLTLLMWDDSSLGVELITSIGTLKCVVSGTGVLAMTMEDVFLRFKPSTD